MARRGILPPKNFLGGVEKSRTIDLRIKGLVERLNESRVSMSGSPAARKDALVDNDNEMAETIVSEHEAAGKEIKPIEIEDLEVEAVLDGPNPLKVALTLKSKYDDLTL